MRFWRWVAVIGLGVTWGLAGAMPSGVPASASWGMIGGSPAMAREPMLLRPAQFDARTLLHTPPSDTSSVTRAELAELHRIQATRTKAEFNRAEADGQDETVFLFRSVFGPGFTAAKLPVTAAFFAKAGNDEEYFVGLAKNDYRRPRPPELDHTLRACPHHPSFSYPSGHATRAYLLGVLLAAAVPERRDAILERAANYAHDRLVCGVHYPSDIRAGRLTGSALAAVALSRRSVRRQVMAVRQELLAAGFVPPVHKVNGK